MDELEWKTRKTRIDTRLRNCHPTWQIVRYRANLDLSSLTNHAVEEFPTDNGPADYALFVDGHLLGIIEAKKVGVGAQNVLEQAKRYSLGATNGTGNWSGYHVPFLYATNGEQIWHIDMREPKAVSRPVSAFHTAPALGERFARDDALARRWLLATLPDEITRLRPYQRNCIKTVEPSLLQGRRDLLVAMATGTGKTFLTVAQIYRLLASGFARRVLFLVDRKALAAQAVREFSAFNTPHGNKFTQEYEVYSQRFQRDDFGDDDPFDPKLLPNEYLIDPKPSHTFVCVWTIQRLARTLFGPEYCFGQTREDAELEDDTDRLNIPIHAFDLIIADECHRGYTADDLSVWRDTIQHFDAVRLGLTATPAAHTVALFGQPVFEYRVEQGVREGYLVDYEAFAIRSGVLMNGVFLKEGELVENVDATTGAKQLDLLEDERQFPAEEVERKITAPDCNRKIIAEVATHCRDHQAKTGRFPKTLIFAVNDLPHASHADQLVWLCREIFAQGDAFVQKITGSPSVDRPLQRIREFRNRPEPKVVVTVDMLSTGVDIPALEFIVFLRPVKSRILWEQMLGRGTRRCDDINKTHFTIFDCFDGSLIRYFRGASNFVIEPPHAVTLTLPQVIENIWQNIDRTYHTNVLVRRLRRIERDMSGDARLLFGRWVTGGDIGRFAGELPQRLQKDFTGAMKLLRDSEFQDALLNYPRARPPFIIAHATVDEVSSQEIDRFGKFANADDYLTAFSAFVRANAAKITALRVLLRAPAGWGPAPLQELQSVLGQNEFNADRLRRAHARKGHQAVADIISLVKNAADAESPLLTAEQRVQRAFDRLQTKLTLTTEQQQWLTLIREHLISNLSLDESDFDNQPIFADRGGAARARRLFGRQLPTLITRINEEIAA